jgi:hypothetical protein
MAISFLTGQLRQFEREGKLSILFEPHKTWTPDTMTDESPPATEPPNSIKLRHQIPNSINFAIEFPLALQ